MVKARYKNLVFPLEKTETDLTDYVMSAEIKHMVHLDLPRYDLSVTFSVPS